MTLFPRTLAEHGHKLADDLVVAVRGRLDRRDEARVNLICQAIEVLEGLEDGPAPTLTLRIPPAPRSTSCDPAPQADPARPPRRLGRDARPRQPGAAPGRRLPRRRRPRRRRAAHGLRPRRDRCCDVLAPIGELGDPSRASARSSERTCRMAAPESSRSKSALRRTSVGTRKRGHGSPGANERFGGPHRLRPRRTGVDGRGVRHRRTVEGQGGLGPRHHRRASTASCTASRSRPSSASAARRACCIGLMSVRRSSKRDQVLRA